MLNFAVGFQYREVVIEGTTHRIRHAARLENCPAIVPQELMDSDDHWGRVLSFTTSHGELRHVLNHPSIDPNLKNRCDEDAPRYDGSAFLHCVASGKDMQPSAKLSNSAAHTPYTSQLRPLTKYPTPFVHFSYHSRGKNNVCEGKKEQHRKQRDRYRVCTTMQSAFFFNFHEMKPS